MSWKPPYKTSGFSAITDMYKFALTVIRCLSEQTNQDTIDYSHYKHLLPSSDFAKLHSLLTSPDPNLTSDDLGALARAWQASVKRDGRMYRRTDSAAREPWTAAMRKAHLAGLPTSTSSTHGTSGSASASKSASARNSSDPSAQTATWRDAPRADSPDAPTGSARSGWMVAAGIAVLALVVLMIIAAISSNNHNRSSSTNTSTGTTTTTSREVAIRSAEVSNCIRRVPRADNPDRSQQVVSSAACDSQSATDRVTRVAENIYACGDSEYVTTLSPPIVVTCLQPI